MDRCSSANVCTTGFGTPQRPKRQNSAVPLWDIDRRQCPCGSGSVYEARQHTPIPDKCKSFDAAKSYSSAYSNTHKNSLALCVSKAHRIPFC